MITKTGYGIIILFVLFMTGCTLTPEEASRMSMYQLCEKMLLSNNSTTRDVAYDTLQHDGTLDACRANADTIYRAHEAAVTNFTNQLDKMNTQLNQQQQRQPQTFCNTYGQGQFGTVHCWQQ